ncbi:MAG: histone deacetylase, partial [bacterium]
MSGLAYFWDPLFLAHDTGRHVEGVGRAERLRPERMAERVAGLDLRAPLPHGAAEWVLRVHEAAHHEFVRGAHASGLRVLDQGDTLVSERSYEAALAAVDAALSAADAVLGGDAVPGGEAVPGGDVPSRDGLTSAFCAVRPPGHHALPFQSMGFCLFATASILARYIQERHGLRRLAIVDWDVHHGNGTQHVFWTDPEVLYVSLHQHPLYPGSGMAEERGEGPGEGATINLPLPPGTGEAAYLARFEEEAVPAVRAHGPELLIISAGFDSHREDPLGGLGLTEAGYARMTRLLREAVEECCGGRIVSLLEGGYNLDALERSV